jgi:hypothetical protein
MAKMSKNLSLVQKQGNGHIPLPTSFSVGGSVIEANMLKFNYVYHMNVSAQASTNFSAKLILS